jgi:F0F1-type ATP synthase beta subunit
MIRSFLTCLCQPFLIAEPFNGRPGEQVAHWDFLDEIESLLD